jgi:hypothetical protein
MTNWLDRAKREIPKSSGQGTAVTDKISISAVLAVPRLGESGISGVNNGSIGSTTTMGFQKIESMNMGAVDTLPPGPAMTDAVHQQMGNQIPQRANRGTAVTDEIDLTVVIMPPAVHQQPAANLEEFIEDIGRTAPPLPTIKEDGTLVIPFDSHPRYHWWNGGQSIAITLAELGACQGVTEDYGWRWKE